MAKSEYFEKRIVTGKECPEFRVAFANVFQAKQVNNKGNPKFSMTLLFPKSTDLAPLKRAANAALCEKFGPDKTKWPKNLRNPFRDGDTKPDLEGYEGHIFIGATSEESNPPAVYGPGKNVILPNTPQTKEFYSGCYAKAKLCAFAYDTSGNTGVSFSLWAVQKVKDGEPFGGRDHANDFEAVAGISPEFESEMNF